MKLNLMFEIKNVVNYNYITQKFFIIFNALKILKNLFI